MAEGNLPRLSSAEGDFDESFRRPQKCWRLYKDLRLASILKPNYLAAMENAGTTPASMRRLKMDGAKVWWQKLVHT